jgi:hypothetical protein
MPLFDRSKGMSKWVFSNLLFKIIPGRSKYLLIEYLNSPSRASTFKFSLINSGRDALMDIDSKWGRRDLFWHGCNQLSIEPLIHGSLLTLASYRWIWSPLRCLASLRPHVRKVLRIQQNLCISLAYYQYVTQGITIVIVGYWHIFIVLTI